MALTSEMRTALTVLRGMGVAFHVTDEVSLDCGCVLMLGYGTSSMEPGWQASMCSDEHLAAGERVRARWLDPDVVERFGQSHPRDSFTALLAEELERGS